MNLRDPRDNGHFMVLPAARWSSSAHLKLETEHEKCSALDLQEHESCALIFSLDV